MSGLSDAREIRDSEEWTDFRNGPNPLQAEVAAKLPAEVTLDALDGHVFYCLFEDRWMYSMIAKKTSNGKVTLMTPNEEKVPISKQCLETQFRQDVRVIGKHDAPLQSFSS